MKKPDFLLTATVFILCFTFSSAPIQTTVGQQEKIVLGDSVISNEIVIRFHEDRIDRTFESGFFELTGAADKREFPFVRLSKALIVGAYDV